MATRRGVLTTLFGGCDSEGTEQHKQWLRRRYPPLGLIR
jgi:hypothetical protein